MEAPGNGLLVMEKMGLFSGVKSTYIKIKPLMTVPTKAGKLKEEDSYLT